MKYLVIGQEDELTWIDSIWNIPFCLVPLYKRFISSDFGQYLPYYLQCKTLCNSRQYMLVRATKKNINKFTYEEVRSCYSY